MASIQKRTNGRWAVRWRDLEGNQRWATFKSHREANEHRRRVELGLIEVARPPAPVTLGEYYELWLPRQPWRPSTVDQVASHYRRHILPAFAARQLGSIERAELQTWVTSLGQRLAPSSVSVVAAHLRVLMAEAERDGVIGRSPAEGVRLPREQRKVVVPPTTGQVQRLAGAITPRHRTLVMLAAATGMRQGELFGLTTDRVDREGRQIVVDRQLVKTSNGIQFGPPKTPASSRTIPVPDHVLALIDEHLEDHRSESGLVFTGEHGAPLDRTRFSDRWRPAARAAGLPSGQGMHCLRHYYASMLIRAGCSVKVVQARLGHATAAETLDTYAHLWSDDDDRTRLAVEAGLSLIEGHS